MEQEILNAAANLRTVLPKGAWFTLSIFPDHLHITLHRCSDWMREQGATVGHWYAFEDGRCQRTLEVQMGSLMLYAIETNKEAGITLDEARVMNAVAAA